MKRYPLYFLLTGFVFLAAFVIPPQKKITIYLAGDSTMCNYEPERAPLTGWGMPFRYFFDSSVSIINRAKGGRSTRTFIGENSWQLIADHLKEGDYVFIQFGHNDEATEEKYKDRYTPVPDYQQNLEKFIEDARSKKAFPVIITPVSRLRFKDGVQQETHAAYTAACYEVAQRQHVPLIDLDAKSRALFQQLGPGASRLLFMQLAPGEHPAYPQGQQDNTHFNAYGARRIAELVLQGIKELGLPLATRLVKVPSIAGITHQPDTSYTTWSAYNSSKKNFPQVKIVPVFHFPSVLEKRNITYCTVGERELKLDAFFPAGNKIKNRTAVLIVHGGGWRSGNRSQHYPLAQKLAAAGYVCFTPEYRLSTEALYPAAVYDLKAAIRWIRAQAKVYQLDTSKIAVLGFSAGGELAAFLGTTNDIKRFEGKGCYNANSSAVNAIIDLDGTLSFVHPESAEGDDSKKLSASTLWFGYSKKSNPALLEDASPLTHVSGHTPPVLFINSSVERMHAGRDDFIKVLQQNHVYYQVKNFDNAPHSFPLFYPWFDPMVSTIDGFLKKVFIHKKSN